MTAAAWPFWKTVPRFDREYSVGDLFRVAGAWTHRPKESALAEVSALFPAEGAFFVRNGRESLYLILKALGLRRGSRVGVPLYCCAVVFEAITAAGHVPVFLDIDLNTYALDEDFLQQNRHELDALLVVHTFGYPADIERIRDCLGGGAIPVMEDCAHALLTECRGRLAGTQGDASFFSFGIHKPAAVGGGALLLVNNPDLKTAIDREMSHLENESPWEEIRHSLTCWARSLAYRRSVYGAILASSWGRCRDEESRTPTPDDLARIHLSWSPSNIRSVDLLLIARRMAEFREKMPVLAENAMRLREQLRDTPFSVPPDPPCGKWNHFMYPVRYPSAEQCAVGRRFLAKRGVDTSPLYQNCVRNARWFGYEGGCHHAEHASRTVCTVPLHPWLSDPEIAYIGESLRLSAEPE